MKILAQFFVILLFYALGVLASQLIGGLIPGSVFGMFFLFLALKGGVVKPHQVDEAALFLTSIMGVLFIPAGVGLVTQLPILKRYWHIILLSMMLSTVIVMATVALSQQHFESHSGKAKPKAARDKR